MKLLNVWCWEGVTRVKVFSEELGIEIMILNVYGPCQNRTLFWETIMKASSMEEDNIVMGGDLNYSLGLPESWGHNAQIDSLMDFF